MNVSKLVHGLRSMRHIERIMREGDGEPTISMEFGTAVHMLALQPLLYPLHYAIMPDFHNDADNVTQSGKPTTSRATTYCAQRVKAFTEANTGKRLITTYEHNQVCRVVHSMLAKQGVVDAISTCQKEVELYGTICGVECKGRVDLLRTGYLADLKTTKDCEPRKFGRTYSDLHYSFKLAFYRELANQNGYDIQQVQVIAQETSGDYDTVIYDVPSGALDIAFRKVCSVLVQYQECLASGVWPGVDGGQASLVVPIPPWELEEEVELEWGVEESVSELDEVSPF